MPLFSRFFAREFSWESPSLIVTEMWPPLGRNMETQMFRSAANIWEDKLARDAAVARAFAEDAPEISPAEGIVAGTQIATAMGWRPIEAIAVGDRVMTFDHGLRPVASVKRSDLWLGDGRCPSHLEPLAVPEGALGNQRPLLLLPEQPVLVESDMAEALFGDPFVLIPAAALEGYRGIGPVTPHRRVEVVLLEFESDEVVYANGAGMIRCGSVHDGDVETILEGDAVNYETLPFDMARSIVAGLIDEDHRPQNYTFAAE